MMERTYTIKNSDYGYPVTLDEKGEVIDDELITDLPDGILNQFGDAEIEVFDEYGNKIEGGFVNTNLSIYIRGGNDNN